MGRVRANHRLIVLCISVFLLTFAGGAFIGNHLQVGPFDKSISTKAEKGKRINVLFMGIDARKTETNSRSDTMILASIDTKNNKVAMVWIPRDTRVEVSRNRYDKINSVNYLQGPEAACKVVGKLLGTRVDHYVVINFDGFARIVDILGGVTLEVPPNMFHNDPDPKLRINLSPGVQRLNGHDALGYVRFRGGPTADIGRTGRQQKFIKALAEEMLQSKNILKLPELLPELAKNVDTNVPLKDMLAMGKLAKNFGSQEIYTQTLPGYSFTDRKTGASFWQADEEIAQGLIDDLFAGKKYDVAQDPPNWVKKQPQIEIQPVVEEPEDSVQEENEDKPGEQTEDGNTSVGTEPQSEVTDNNLPPGGTDNNPVEQPGKPSEELPGTGNEDSSSSSGNTVPDPEQQLLPPVESDPDDNTGMAGY